jgi:uncharacterized protein
MPRTPPPDPGPVLLVPGIGNSGPDHWQSHWEARHPSFIRVQQQSWEQPVASTWGTALEAAVMAAGRNVVIAAHSLGCLLVVGWAARTALPIRGALLVALPDPAGPIFPAEAIGFSAVPTSRLPFPSTVVASTNDPYGSPSYAQSCATSWGSRFVSIGAAGHINAASGLRDWAAGIDLVRELFD